VYDRKEVRILSLSQLSKEEIQEMSSIEVAYELLAEKRQAISFKQLMDELAQKLELSEEQVRSRIAQFYTDLNIDGRFLCVGENQWGLRVWYPVDQVIEEIVNPVKAKKKKKAKKVVDKLDDFDDIEELEVEEFDDLEEFVDDEDDDEDLVEDDLDEATKVDLDDDLIDDDLDDDLDEEIDDEEFEVEEEEEFDDSEKDKD
jgi:DNA-directed RNA polymerase subunit delta